MKVNLLKVASVLAVAVLFLAPVASFTHQAFAQNDPNPYIDPTPIPGGNNGPIESKDDVFGLLGDILGWVATIFWIAAAFFIFVAAFKYLTAAGDPTKVKAASTMLLYAVVAIAVAIISYGLPKLVESFLGGN